MMRKTLDVVYCADFDGVLCFAKPCVPMRTLGDRVHSSDEHRMHDVLSPRRFADSPGVEIQAPRDTLEVRCRYAREEDRQTGV